MGWKLLFSFLFGALAFAALLFALVTFLPVFPTADELGQESELLVRERKTGDYYTVPIKRVENFFIVIGKPIKIVDDNDNENSE